MGNDDGLRAIRDEIEIRNLIARLAHEADDGDLEGYLSLFTSDARWGGGDQPVREGRAAILEGARSRRDRGLAGPGTGTRHVVNTTWLQIEGDRATGRSVYHYYTAIDTTSPSLAAMGVYADVFERGPDGWRLAERMLQGQAKDLDARND